MKQFLRFYAWGVEVKLYMSIYTAAVVFFQGITEVLQGRYTISVWVVCANVLYIGGALVFGWFPGVPLWGDILLILLLECGLAAIWFGEQVACWRDTRALNRSLRKFQQEG